MTRAEAAARSQRAGQRSMQLMQERFGPQLLAELREPLPGALPADSSLLTMAEYQLDTGGKRLRAYLPLLTAERLEADPARLLPFGAACEILHNATLVHDDVQDGDRFRRGRETVWQRFGIPQAINLGDALFYQAVLLCQRLSFPLEQREAAVRRMLLGTLRTIDGQEREFRLKQVATPALDDYFTMVECKTSGLFALPIAGAAELCGASPAVIAGLEEAARHLGVLFQIQDDLLDVFGDKGRGQAARDLAEGKRSFLVISALRSATAADAQQLCSMLAAREAGPEQVEWAKQLFVKTGAAARACAEIFRRHVLALDVAGLESQPALRDFIDEMFQVFVSPIREVISSVEGAA